MDEVAAIQLGGDLYGQVQVWPSVFQECGLGHRANEITPECDEGAHRVVQHPTTGLHRVETLLARW